MGKKIKSKKARLKAQDEILNHLFDQIEEELAQGLSWQECVRKVMANTTKPKELGKKLNLAHQPWFFRYPKIAYSFIILFTGFTSLVIISHYLAKQSSEMLYGYAVKEELYNDFYADLEDLKKDPYMVFTRKNNVHFYLSKHFEVFSHRKSDKINAEKLCLLSTGVAERCTFKTNEIASLSSYNEKLEKIGYQLDWIDGILEYDHWNFFVDPYISQKINASTHADVVNKIGIWSALDMPETNLFTKLLYLRTTELVQLKQYAKALLVFKKGQQLILSTNTLVGGAVGSNMLRFKNRLIDFYSLSWKKESEDRINLMKRVAWGWTHVLQETSYSGHNTEKIKKYLKPELGMCSGVFESVNDYAWLNGFHQAKYPFEPDYHLSIRDLKKQALSRLETCGVTELKPFLQSSGVLKSNLKQSLLAFSMVEESWMTDTLALIPLSVEEIPYVRSIIGSILNSVAIPNYISPYVNEETKRRNNNSDRTPSDVYSK